MQYLHPDWFAIAMVGNYQANRWVRKPRPGEQFRKVFMSLHDKYIHYHYP